MRRVTRAFRQSFRLRVATQFKASPPIGRRQKYLAKMAHGRSAITTASSCPLPSILGTSPQNIAIQGEILIGVCEEICIPVTLPFSAVLPVNGVRDAAISAAMGDQPMTQSAAKVGTVTCNIDPIADGLRMTTSIDVAATGASEHVVIEASDPRVWVSEARTQACR